MSGCDCPKARADLEDYLRQELSAEQASVIREHLAGCSGCASEAHIETLLTEVVRRSCRETAPEQLRAKLMGLVRDGR